VPDGAGRLQATIQRLIDRALDRDRTSAWR